MEIELLKVNLPSEFVVVDALEFAVVFLSYKLTVLLVKAAPAESYANPVISIPMFSLLTAC